VTGLNGKQAVKLRKTLPRMLAWSHQEQLPLQHDEK
jgi:hypothetical protein